MVEINIRRGISYREMIDAAIPDIGEVRDMLRRTLLGEDLIEDLSIRICDILMNPKGSPDHSFIMKHGLLEPVLEDITIPEGDRGNCWLWMCRLMLLNRWTRAEMQRRGEPLYEFVYPQTGVYRTSECFIGYGQADWVKEWVGI